MALRILIVALLAGVAGLLPSPAASQLVLSIAPDWDSQKGKLQLFEKHGHTWKAASPVIPVLYGKHGLAWGRGLFGQGQPGPVKVERDKRAPAGLFRIGKIYTFDPGLPEGAHYPFFAVTKGSAWIDDPAHPDYNRHVEVDPENPPSWFEKQKMRHNDPAHRWLVEIRHNADPPVAGAGSAIFFHIRRGESRPSAGCTVMAPEDLVTMIRWLREDAEPVYALFPENEYLARWKALGLPSPAEAEGVLGGTR